jgi:NADH:ubiquinone reductase (H+-translocating)
MAETSRIVIVGGGAGGLELATRLGDRLSRLGQARITLVDRSRTHIWKPLLHQIAAGSMDQDVHELDYLAQAHWHHYDYRIGEMIGLDRARRQIQIAAHVDEEGREITPRRSVPYDTLVIAAGSQSNDFGTPGVREHAISLDTPDAARLFHTRLVNACIRAQAQTAPLHSGQLHVAIIGAGATGIELAAELHYATRELVAYGLDRIDPNKDMRLVLIEAAERILPALPQRLSAAAAALLTKLGVQQRTSARVSEVTSQGVGLASGEFIPAELVVWSAGVKCADFIRDLDGLETNQINQLVVTETLQTSRDPNIFALGDCAACPWLGRAGATVPPRAQAAHQQASHLARQLQRQLRGKPLQA